MVKRFFPAGIVVTASVVGGSCTTDDPPPAPDPFVLQTDTMTVSVGSPRFSLEVKNAAGDVILSTLDDTGTYQSFTALHRSVAFQSHVIEGWDYQIPTDGKPIAITKVTAATHTGSTASIELASEDGAATAHIDITIEGSELHVASSKLTGPALTGEVDDRTAPGLNLQSMAFELPADEHFYGLGERGVSVDHRGRTYENWVEEGGLAGGETAPPGPTNPSPNGPGMTHAPVPFWLSTKGYAAWLDTTYRTGTSFGGERPDAMRVYAFAPTLNLRVFVRAAPRDAIADFTAKAGRAHLPAPWVFGPRRRMNRNAIVDGVPEMQRLRELKVPCTAADDATHFLPIGSHVGKEMEIAKWTSDLHTLGYKAIAYYNAYVSTTDERAAEDYAFGRDNGYFVKLEDGTEFDTFMISAGPQQVATIDMTNPDAVTWFGTLLQRSLDLSYDGFMLDFGEYLPPDAILHDGRTGWEAHNAFPIDYQRATWDFMTKAKGNDFMYFARAGYTGTQAFIPVHWSGDPDASFDPAKGLPAQVRSGINAGISGIPIWGSDVSGYTCLNNPPADKDVFLRWVEFGALSPEMHEENACSGSMGGQEKWTLYSDAETIAVYAKYAGLHTQLFPYIYAAAKEATETGFPIMRHPVLLHPEMPETYALDTEYWFGPALYVAPVVERAATSRDLVLPPGKWVDWWTLEPLASGKITRPAALDELPLFLLSGNVVAMIDPSVQTLAPATDPTVVTLDDVAGKLVVRAAVDPTAAAATATLVDGTKLDVTLASGAVTLPAGITLTDEAGFATCAECGLVETLPSGVTRVRIDTANASVTAGALTLTRAAPTSHVRWDVAILP